MAAPTTTNNAPIRYGWCHTDHKDGTAIRAAYARPDYVFDPDTAEPVAAALARLGLPAPGRGDVFRGTHHDMLFVDSHGVVIRIGPTDVTDLIHPAILQPLGWLPDVAETYDGDRLSIAIYPGIHLWRDTAMAASVEEIGRVLARDGHAALDISPRNMGLVPVTRPDGAPAAATVLIDTDNQLNGLEDHYERQRRQDIMKAGAASGTPPPALMSAIMASASRGWSTLDDQLAAFEMHQPLRFLFCRKLEAGRMDEFWARCAALAARDHEAVLSAAEQSAAAAQGLRVRPLPVLRHPWTESTADRKRGNQNALPVLERRGLRYVWERNVSEDEATEDNQAVRLRGARTVLESAIIGPAWRGAAGTVGIYRAKNYGPGGRGAGGGAQPYSP